MKKIVILIGFIFLIGLISANNISIYVKPLDADRNLQPSTAFIYDLNFTTQNDCTSGGMVLNHTQTILTGTDGIGFISVPVLANLSGIPTTLCEYKNTTLRKTHKLSSNFFNETYLQSINTTGDIYSSGNLTLGQKITFKLGEIIDNIINGWIKITGGLNVTESIEVEKNVTIKEKLKLTNGTTVWKQYVDVNGTLVWEQE